MSYNYNRFKDLASVILETMWRNPDDLVIGEDLSDFFEFKVMFNNYGFNEETQQNDNRSVEEYCLFIHKNSGIKGFQFPEHETSPFGIIHRPAEEVCIHAWYEPAKTDDDEDQGQWTIEDLENQQNELSNDEVMQILEKFVTNYPIVL